jgi:hypothetical protein
MVEISKLELGDFSMKIIVFPCKLFSVELIFGLIGGFFVLKCFRVFWSKIHESIFEMLRILRMQNQPIKPK